MFSFRSLGTMQFTQDCGGSAAPLLPVPSAQWSIRWTLCTVVVLRSLF